MILHSNNMLYPKEDRMQKSLLFACRNCDHQEDATQHCVYRNNIIVQHTYANGLLADGHCFLRARKHAVVGLSSDPTLPKTNKRPCPKCGHNDAVFFQSHDRHRDTPMTLNFVCCNPSCSFVWSD